MKMGIETRNAVNLVERSLRALGKTLEFRFGQEAVTKLNGPKVVEDHVARLDRKAPALPVEDARRKVAC
jgi:hypothetical protein